MTDPTAALRQMVNGYRPSQAIHVAARLGIADLLAGGPRSAEDLARAAGAHPEALYRLLRALASVGVFDELEGRRFALNDLAEPLCADAPASLRGWVLFNGNQLYPTWGHLLHSVQTGQTAFDHLHGMNSFDYYALHPEAGREFDRAMSSNVHTMARAVAEAYDFSPFGTVVDVGGGNGALMALILRANPSARGVIFDLPGVVAGAGEALGAAGLRGRCELAGGSFFDAVPAGGDVYILKNIIHDWDDERSGRILEACRRAMPPGRTLLLIERALAAVRPDPRSTMADLNMLVKTGGRERTDPEYAALLTRSGFEVRRLIPVPSELGPQITEAVAV